MDQQKYINELNINIGDLFYSKSMPNLLFIVVDNNNKFYHTPLYRDIRIRTYKLHSVELGLRDVWYTEEWFIDRILNDNFVLQKIKI